MKKKYIFSLAMKVLAYIDINEVSAHTDLCRAIGATIQKLLAERKGQKKDLCEYIGGTCSRSTMTRLIKGTLSQKRHLEKIYNFFDMSSATFAALVQEQDILGASSNLVNMSTEFMRLFNAASKLPTEKLVFITDAAIRLASKDPQTLKQDFAQNDALIAFLKAVQGLETADLEVLRRVAESYTLQDLQ